jgi:signal transduction histidine kinase
MRQRLEGILEGLPCGVLVMESEGQVVIVNPEARRLLGIAGDAPLAAWLRELLEHTHPSSSEFEYQCDNGQVEWITLRRAQLSAEAGGSSVFMVQGISGLKRLEQEHERLRRRQALAEMSALLAHEIRNPLGSLELFAGLLAESDLDGERRRWVKHLQAGLRTLSATVNNVLHFHSQPRPELAPTDLGQLLRSVHDFLQPLAQQARVRLELQNHVDGVFVAADRHRLEQVLLNLALNSFRFMPGGGWLRFAGIGPARDGSRGTRIEVADTGPGIAPENLARIFEAGFTTRPGSPGLGLAVCRTILEQHDGTISAASRPGRGSTFTLEFPRQAERAGGGE